MCPGLGGGGDPQAQVRVVGKVRFQTSAFRAFATQSRATLGINNNRRRCSLTSDSTSSPVIDPVCIRLFSPLPPLSITPVSQKRKLRHSEVRACARGPTASDIRIQTQRLRPARHLQTEKNKARCGPRKKNPIRRGWRAKCTEHPQVPPALGGRRARDRAPCFLRLPAGPATTGGLRTAGCNGRPGLGCKWAIGGL